MMHLSRSVAAALLLTPALGSLYPPNAYELLYARDPYWAERDVPNVAPQILDVTSQTGDGRYTAKGNVRISARDVYGQNNWHPNDPENHLAYHMHHLGNGVASVGSTGLNLGPRHLDIESRSGGDAQYGNPTLQVRSPDAKAYAEAYPYSKELHSGIYARIATQIPRLRPRSPGVMHSRPDDRPPSGSSGRNAGMAGIHMMIPSSRHSPGNSVPNSPATQSSTAPFVGDVLTPNSLPNGKSLNRPRRHSPLNPNPDPFYESPKPSRPGILQQALSNPRLAPYIDNSKDTASEADDEGHSPASRSHAARPHLRLSGIGENEPLRSSARTHLGGGKVSDEIQPYESPVRTPGGRVHYSPVRTHHQIPINTHYHSAASGASGISSPRKATSPFDDALLHSGHSSPGRESHWSREGHASDEEEARKLRHQKYATAYQKHVEAKAKLLAEKEKLAGGHAHGLPQTPAEKAEEKKKEEERRRKGLTSTKPWVAGFIGAAGVAGLLGVGSSTAAVFVSEAATKASEKSTNAALAQVKIGQIQANASQEQVQVQQANVDQAIKQVQIQTADEQAQKTQAAAALEQVKINQQNANASATQASVQKSEEGIQVAQMQIAAQQAETALAVAQKSGANVTQQIPLPGIPLSRRFNLPRKHLADKLVYYGSDKNLLLRDIAARITAPTGLS